MICCRRRHDDGYRFITHFRHSRPAADVYAAVLLGLGRGLGFRRRSALRLLSRRSGADYFSAQMIFTLWYNFRRACR